MRINTLLTVKEVAEILNMSRSRAYNLMLREELPTVRFGKCQRVRFEDLFKYIESNTFQLNLYFDLESNMTHSPSIV